MTDSTNTTPAAARRADLVLLQKAISLLEQNYELSDSRMKAMTRCVRVLKRLLDEDTATPIDMILYCPACQMQHIDAPEVCVDEGCPHYGTPHGHPDDWTNPPHRSHLCGGCGHVWRPADVPTNGVAAITTRGRNDSESISDSQQPAGPATKRIVAYDPFTDTVYYQHNAAPSSAQPVEQRACASSECAWKGVTDRMVGSVGPLCPECGEVTEPVAQPLSYSLSEYAQNQWWVKELEAALDNTALPAELRRATKVATDFVAAVFATDSSDSYLRAYKYAQRDAGEWKLRALVAEELNKIVAAASASHSVKRKLQHIIDCANLWSSSGVSRINAITRTVEELRAALSAPQPAEPDSISGPLSDEQRDHYRTLYGNLNHLGRDSADFFITQVAATAYTNGWMQKKDESRPARTKNNTLAGNALARFVEAEADSESELATISPLERLRFFCSLAMQGQDWLDSEQFFDDLEAQIAAPATAQPAESVAREVRRYCHGDAAWTEWAACDEAYFKENGGDEDFEFRAVSPSSAPPTDADTARDAALIEWAVGRWHAEVARRSLVNAHRRTLDDTWRQVIRHVGGDDVLLLGLRHDDLIAVTSCNLVPPGNGYCIECAQGNYDKCLYVARLSAHAADTDDTARIDWMQQTQCTVFCCVEEVREPKTDGSNGYWKTKKFVGWSASGMKYEGEPHQTIRAAIDAARAAESNAKGST